MGQGLHQQIGCLMENHEIIVVKTRGWLAVNHEKTPGIDLDSGWWFGIGLDSGWWFGT
jgi:hypothetical protein